MKRILRYLLPLLVVLFFVCIPVRDCKAATTLTDTQKVELRDVITSVVADNSYINAYYINMIDGTPYLYLLPRLTSAVKQPNGSLTFEYAISHYDSAVPLKTFIFRGTAISRVDDIRANRNTNLTGVPSTALYCNFNIKNADGTIFFHQRPLAGRILEVAQLTMIAEVPKMEQIAKVVMIILVSSVLLLLLLPTFIKKLLVSLTR